MRRLIATLSLAAVLTVSGATAAAACDAGNDHDEENTNPAQIGADLITGGVTGPPAAEAAACYAADGGDC
jgi:hypothetical protein